MASKDELMRTLQEGRRRVASLIEADVPVTEMGTTSRRELDRNMICCLLRDADLTALSPTQLQDIVRNGWWSEVGRAVLRRHLDRDGRQ
ncbi:MAG: hypothetical protein HY343_00605 [Lentisphaerae bacterium]|nr:hypothetical protein [Lentisphaerota bacterium]